MKKKTVVKSQPKPPFPKLQLIQPILYPTTLRQQKHPPGGPIHNIQQMRNLPHMEPLEKKSLAHFKIKNIIHMSQMKHLVQ